MVHEQPCLRINWRPLNQSWKKVIQNIGVLPTKVVRDVLAPARERHDPHKPPHLRTTFFAMADSRRVHDAQAPCLPTETSFWELAKLARFARLARLASFARGNGVINCSTEPPYHTRRGPG